MTASCTFLLLSDYAGGGQTAGGAGLAAMESFRALRSAGLAARMMTGFEVDSSGADEAGIERMGGSDLRDGPIWAQPRTIYNPASRKALSKMLLQFDPDRTIVVLHQWTRYLTPSAIALLAPYRMMIVLHDHFWACPNGAYFDFVREEPCRRRPGGGACMAARCDTDGRARKLVRMARHVARRIAVRGATHEPVYLHLSQRAQAVAEPLIGAGHHAVLHNPLRVAVEARRDATPDFDIGYFGRFEPQKGVSGLLDAVRADGATGMFVGEGSLADAVIATPGVLRLPWQTHENARKLMQRCRLLVLPSLWPETWGLVTAEAMAAGVPVLVSTRAGSAELVERLGGGMVFDPTGSDAIARAIGRCVDEGAALPLDRTGMSGLKQLLSSDHHAGEIARIAERAWGVTIAAAASSPNDELEPA